MNGTDRVKKVVVRRDHPEDALPVISYYLADGNVEAAIKVYRVVFKDNHQHEYARQARESIADSIRKNLSDIFVDGEGFSERANIYLNRFDKKIDIVAGVEPFSSLARQTIAEKRCFLIQDRLYTLFQSIRNCQGLPGCVIEAGVYQGGGLKFIAACCSALGQSRNLYGLDTFAGHAGVTDKDGFNAPEMFKGTSEAAVAEYLADYPAVRLLKGDARTTLPELLQGEEQIAFAHVDLDLYEPTAVVLQLLGGRMAPRGIVVVDDYGVITCPGVKEAVDAFVADRSLLKFHQLTGQCVLVF